MAKISIDFDRKKIILYEDVSPKELEQLIASISSFSLDTKMEKTNSITELQEKIKKQVMRNDNITWSGGPLFNPELLKPDDNPKVNIRFEGSDKAVGVRPFINYGEYLND